MDTTNDNTLFINIQRDDKKSFDSLFRKYYRPLYWFALQLNNSQEAAEEAVQDVFIGIWEQRHNLTVLKSVKSYLFQSVRNKVYEQFRKTQTRIKYEEEYSSQQIEKDVFELSSPSSDSPDNYELACLIWDAVSKLPEKCREIFQLSRDEGLTYSEIATHLQISPKTVENQMGIAFKKLREILQPVLGTSKKAGKYVDLFLLGSLFLLIEKISIIFLGVLKMTFIL